MVVEVGQADIPILEGYVGNLSTDQEVKLREMWERFFEICDKATGSAKTATGEAAGWGSEDNDPKKAGIPKGDAAKEELKKKEEEAAMKALLSTYGSDALRDTFWKFVKFDNPDTTMLRFLRARKWDVSRSIAMLASCLKWRLDNAVEKLAEAGDLGNGKIEKFLDQQRSGKTYALGTALNEQPICYIHVGKHRTFGQPGASLQKYVIYAMESFRLFMVPPNDKVILLFDLTDFGLRCMDWNCILFIVKCLEAYYPESLGTLFIMNAPWIFWGIWKILGPLLDPVVRSKVVFVGKPEDMKQHVPEERLLAQFGGTMTTTFEFVEPKEGENDRQKETEKRSSLEQAYAALASEYEKVTREWIQGGGKNTTLNERRELLVRQLRVAQYDLEPYSRGLCVTHRDGTLDGQGKVTWVYRQKNGDDIRHVVGRAYCVATIRREIEEMKSGSSAAQAVEKTNKALRDNDYVTLYGSEKIARKLEGSRVDRVVPPIGLTGNDAIESGGAPAAKYGSILLAPDVDEPAVAPVKEAAPAASGSDFKDAPQASEKQAEAAQDGDKTAAQAEAQPTAAEKVADKAAPVNGSNLAIPAADKEAVETGDDAGTGTLGRRFSKMMGRMKA